jgi:hypothetical protein
VTPSRNSNLQNRPLAREGAPHQQTHMAKDKLRKEENSSWVPDGCLTPRRAGRLTVGRNILLALTFGRTLFNSLQFSSQRHHLHEWRPEIQSRVSVIVESLVAVAEARGQFGNPDEGERLPFDPLPDDTGEYTAE